MKVDDVNLNSGYGKFTETILLKEKYKCAFQRKQLFKTNLVEDGLSSVRALLDSGHEGIYTLTDKLKLTRFWVKWR
jgi:hypothetical protein